MRVFSKKCMHNKKKITIHKNMFTLLMCVHIHVYFHETVYVVHEMKPEPHGVISSVGKRQSPGNFKSWPENTDLILLH